MMPVAVSQIKAIAAAAVCAKASRTRRARADDVDVDVDVLIQMPNEAIENPHSKLLIPSTEKFSEFQSSRSFSSFPYPPSHRVAQRRRGPCNAPHAAHLPNPILICQLGGDCNGQQNPDTCLGRVSIKFALEFERGLTLTQVGVHLGMIVPSADMPESSNIITNHNHKSFADIEMSIVHNPHQTRQ
jgi:hypothetical protein